MKMEEYQFKKMTLILKTHKCINENYCQFSASVQNNERFSMTKKEKTEDEASAIWRYRYYILVPVGIVTILAALLIFLSEDEQAKPFVYAVF